MRKKIVGLYDPYLNVMGGGERYVLSILKVLENEGHEVNIFWSKNLKEEIKNRLNLPFKNLIFLPNIFPYFSFYKKYLRLKKFDIFMYVSDGSYFFSAAKKNFIYAMVPQQNLYPTNILDRLKTFNYKFITHSSFNQENLKNWNISSKVIYPYLNEAFMDKDNSFQKKEKIILSVGRFYKHLHAKRQDMLIKSFKQMKQKNSLFKDYKLILTGGLLEEDKKYLNELRSIINDDESIDLLPNLPFNKLIELYKKSSFFWHFTGYGIDENKNPELVEHLGITPLEAMATGNIVFAYNAGGPKELIRDNETGYLFNDINELENKMSKIISDEELQAKIRKNAKSFVKENFSYEVFRDKVKKIIL